MEVLLQNFAYHRLSFDADWKCEYFDLQYVYQKLVEGSLGCQPSLEKAVTELELDADLDSHSAWNDTYYTILVYQAMLDRFENMTLFHRPPKQKGVPPLWEMDLGTFDTRWACKNRREVSSPVCPLCGEPVAAGRWLRTTPTEQVMRGKCKEHRRLYVAVTVTKEGQRWAAKAAIYKEAGSVAERYRKAARKVQENRRSRKKTEQPAGVSE